MPAELGDVLRLSPRRPHVLTVGLRDPSGRHRGAPAARGGTRSSPAPATRPEGRRYLPHVTVARVRTGAKVRPGDVALPGCLAASFALEALTLYRSEPLPDSSPRYEALASRLARVIRPTSATHSSHRVSSRCRTVRSVLVPSGAARKMDC